MRAWTASGTRGSACRGGRRRGRPVAARPWARRLSVGRARRRHLDVRDRVAGRRRGPDQRRRRAGRDDPRVAPPERALRLLPLDHRQRRRPPDARFGLHGGALDRVSRPRRVGQHAGVPARGAVRCAGPLRRRDRHGRATSHPVSTSGARGRPGWPRWIARWRWPSCSRSRSPTARARSRGCADRRGHRTYRESRLEPGDPVTIIGRALPFADLSDPLAADLGTGAGPRRRRPRDRGRPRRRARRGHPGRRPGGGVGQRRHRGLRDRAAGGGAGARSRA